ncbi:MAG: class I SAM-dependent methyltransferase [Desulfobacterales bacterium]|nr:class I SAM-dependent methyltransferase [Desulfobacterales bacterium]
MNSILNENSWVFDIAKCLIDSPYKKAARRFVELSLKLGNGPSQQVFRSLISISVFKEKVMIEKSDEHPIEPFIECLNKHSDLIEASLNTIDNLPKELNEENFDVWKDVVKSTGEHFGALFSDFTDEIYFEDGLKVVTDRLVKNDFPMDKLQGKKAIDAGCGGGRYSVALRKLGLGDVTGMDMSDTGLANARKRIEEHNIDGVNFKKGNVLDIPFEDETFDFVWSSGVLHHTTDMQKGVNELLRVMKTGGCGYFYLIENPGGIFWDTIDLLRILLKNVSFEFAQTIYKMAGVSSYDIFYILDHVQVPINIYSTPEEVEQLLKNAGAKSIRRLERGTDFDRVELIYNKQPYADYKYGVGENRYYYEK